MLSKYTYLKWARIFSWICWRKNQLCRTKADIVVWADQTSCGIQVGGEVISFINKMSLTKMPQIQKCLILHMKNGGNISLGYLKDSMPWRKCFQGVRIYSQMRISPSLTYYDFSSNPLQLSLSFLKELALTSHLFSWKVTFPASILSFRIRPQDIFI